ncbi:MAG: GerMN domain-containing protein [bacterium]|nr:GerMN domain-containing protein [bacterium]MDW8164041.1 GerMN domain-containing protein [Candidatus Omnitrophota bacterium]
MSKDKKGILLTLIIFLILLLLFLAFLKLSEKITQKTTVYIFLTYSENEKIMVKPVKRKIGYYGKLENKIKKTLIELIKGPTEEEKKKGFSTSLNENTKILDIKIEDSTLNINFSKEVEEGGGISLMEARIAQIVYTGTQFPEINKVRFLIEGNPIKYFSGEGITIVEKPISREDLKEFEIQILKEEKNEERDTS